MKITRDIEAINPMPVVYTGSRDHYMMSTMTNPALQKPPGELKIIVATVVK